MHKSAEIDIRRGVGFNCHVTIEVGEVQGDPLSPSPLPHSRLDILCVRVPDRLVY